jgi:DNA-binding transcriptional MerR regulator
MYYKIGEASARTGVPSYLIRYWEGVFPELKPRKGPGGHRLYTDEHIELIRRIRHLVLVRKYTLRGARAILFGEESKEVPRELLEFWIEELKGIAEELKNFGA